MSGRTVHQADLPRRLREAFKRIRILEARTATGGGSGSGSYVFLAEVLVASDGDPIEFLAISQAYRHLVVEVVGGTDQSVGDAANPDDLRIQWGSAGGGWITDYYQYGLGWFWSNTDPPPWNTDGNPGDDTAVIIPTILPAKNINQSGSGDDYPSVGSATVKLSYYSADDLMKSILWEAQGSVQGAGTTNPSVIRNAFSVGGGTRQGGEAADIAPIDQVRLVPSVNGWKAGSRASLYGIA